MVDGYTHALQSADWSPAGPDLDRCRRPDRSGIFILFLVDRRPVLLRDVVGHGELADDLRVLARRRRPRQLVLAPDQQADADADELDLAGRGRRVHPRPALPLQPGRLRGDHLDRGHRPVRRLHRAGVPAPPGRQQVPGRPVDARPLEPADRDRRDDLGRVHLRPVHAPAGLPGSRSSTFNYTPVVFLVVLGGAAIWYFVSAKHWFKGPKVQGTPEELAAIETRPRASI